MKKKIYCIGVFILVLVITVFISITAMSCGATRLDLPLALVFFGLMFAGFILLLVGCRLCGNHGEKNF